MGERCPICKWLYDGGHACSTVPVEPVQEPINPQHVSIGHDGSVWVVMPNGQGARVPFVVDGRKARRRG